MTPKEKANSIVFKMLKYSTEQCTDLSTGNCSKYKFDNAKKCALIAVDEILEIPRVGLKYWQQVKQEIELL